MKFFRKNARLVKELKEQLSAAEVTIHALQDELQIEREERAAVEMALHDSTNFSKTIQEEMRQKTVRLLAVLEKTQQAAQNVSEQSQRILQDTDAMNRCLHEKMEQKNDEISRLESELLLTKTNLEIQQQETRNALDQAQKGQQKLEEKQNIIRHLEDMIGKYQIQEQAMVKDFQSMKEAIVTCEQNMEEQKNHLQCALDLSDERYGQLERSLSIAVKELEKQSLKHQNEVQTLKKACEVSVQEAKTQVQKYLEETQRNQQLQVTLKDKDGTIGNLEEKIKNLQNEVHTLKDSSRSSEEAKSLLENYMEEMRMEMDQKILVSAQLEKDLADRVKVLEKQGLQMQEKDLVINNLKTEIERVREDCKMSMQEVKIRSEKKDQNHQGKQIFIRRSRVVIKPKE